LHIGENADRVTSHVFTEVPSAKKIEHDRGDLRVHVMPEYFT
jgi:hypothetical protein